MSENTTTPTIDSIEETNTPEQKYVCFVKRRPGGKFIPYTEPGNSDRIVAGTLRQFLDHQISEWYKAGEKEQPENRPLLKVSLDDFAADIHANGMNAKLVSLLGWNYPQAIRMAESEGTIFLLTIHPRFQSIPFSFRQTCDDTDYALHLVEQLLSLRGGRIAFEEHDPEKHSGTCEFSGTSAIRCVFPVKSGCCASVISKRTSFSFTRRPRPVHVKYRSLEKYGKLLTAFKPT